MAAEAAFARSSASRRRRYRAFDSYDEELRASYGRKDLHEARNMRQARQGLLRRRRAREPDDGDEGEAAASTATASRTRRAQ